MSQEKYTPPPPARKRPYVDENGYFEARVVTFNAGRAVSLSPLSSHLWAFFARFESGCSLDCCGFNAVEFSLPSDSERDTRWEANRDIQKAMQAWREEVSSVESHVISVPELRERLYRDDLLFLIDYLLEGIERGEQWG